MSRPTEKAAGAYRTISEVAAEIGVPQHVLRFWETRFEQLQPLKRGGNRRYYRPADVALLRDINRLLYHEGYTIKGVQKLFAEGGARPAAVAAPAPPSVPGPPGPMDNGAVPGLRAIRDRLAAGLAAARAGLGAP